MIKAVDMDMEKVEQLRNNHLWTWSDLARKADITQSTLFSLKAGRRRASFRTVLKIARALDVEPKSLIKAES